METAADTPATALALDSFMAGVFGVLFVAACVALSGRYHSSVPLARWYWGTLCVGAALRCVKLGVPQFAIYRAFLTPPDVDTPNWWLMMGEWVVFVAGNACTVICYSLILRMWHNALSIVAYGGKAPVWPQLVILYVVALGIATDVVLTVMLAFVTPDTVNVVNAFKDCVEAMVVVASFLGYWALLRRSLQQIAVLGVGRPMAAGGSLENTIGEKAMRKLRRISWVSAVCTVGSLYRAGSLLHFALAVIHLFSYGATSPTAAAVERLCFFLGSDAAPAITMLVVMAKCPARRAADVRGSLQSPGATPMAVSSAGSSKRYSGAAYAFSPLA